VADSHEARKAIAAWKVAKYERKVEVAIAAALKTHQTNAQEHAEDTDPFDLKSWPNSVQQQVDPAVRSVFHEIVADIAGTVGLTAAVLMHKVAPSGTTVASTVEDNVGAMNKKVTVVGENFAKRFSLVIDTSTDAGVKADKISSLLTAFETQPSLVARSVNFFANAVSTQAALTVAAEGGNTVTRWWTTMGDDRVREDHVDADGTSATGDNPFIVGGESLMYPGDPNGSEAETANCRCWIVTETSGPKTNSSTNVGNAGTPDDLTASAGRSLLFAPKPMNRADRRRAERSRRKR
jgi:phage-related minor tail protein